MMLGLVRGAIHRSLFDLISVCREAVGRGRRRLRPSLERCREGHGVVAAPPAFLT